MNILFRQEPPKEKKIGSGANQSLRKRCLKEAIVEETNS